MEEKIFLEGDNIKVTSSRFVSDGATYPIANISSVKSGVQPASKVGPLLMILVGLLLGSASLIFPIAFIIISIVMLAKSKSTYSVVLTSAGSDQTALQSSDKETIDKVIAALNDAIVHRG